TRWCTTMSTPTSRRSVVMALLPSEFADLEPYAATWSLATEHERYTARLSSSMEDMQAFYDAVFPRADAARTYLDQFPLAELPRWCTTMSTPTSRRSVVMALLPSEFADLEPYAATWSLATEHERYTARLSSSMEDMQAFYDAVFPRADAARTYLDQFPLAELP